MAIAYLIGSIPTSVWWGRSFHGIDVREHGSRNAGATNTFRVLGPKAGVPVLLIDIAKGFVPVRVLPNFTDLGPDTNLWMWFRVALVLAAVHVTPSRVLPRTSFLHRFPGLPICIARFALRRDHLPPCRCVDLS